MKKLLVNIAALAMLGAGCAACMENDAENYSAENGGVPTNPDEIKFTSRIATTRAYDTWWESGDCIGVYMVAAGSEDWTVGGLAANKKYTTMLSSGDVAANVTFSGTDSQNTIVWPKDDSAVDFVAYYPWSAECTDCGKLNINLTQSRELMWSNNATAMSGGENAPNLVFEHVLSRLRFNVSDTGGRSLAGMTAVLSGVPTTAQFDLRTGAISSAADVEEIEASVMISADDPSCATIEAVVMPGTGLDYTLTITLDDGASAEFVPSESTTYTSGKRYIYDLALSESQTEVVAELNSITQWDDQSDGTTHEITTTSGGSGNETGNGTASNSNSASESESNAQGASYSSGTLAAGSSVYSVAGDGKFGSDGWQMDSGRATITLNGYTGGVGTIALVVGRSMGQYTLIESVSVGGIALTCGGAESVAATKKTHTFVAPSGSLPSGNIEIVMTMGDGSVLTLSSFTIN